jgi:hypothetical protein
MGILLILNLIDRWMPLTPSLSPVGRGEGEGCNIYEMYF